MSSSNPILETEDAAKAVQFGTIWKCMAALSFVMLSGMTGLLLTWGFWVTMTVNDHGESIAVLNERSGHGKDVTQSVNVGAVDATEALAKGSAKTWLTTKDVAEREGKSERTIINYIESGMIEPPPVKNGKSWDLAETYRIIRPDTENCGKIPNDPKP